VPSLLNKFMENVVCHKLKQVSICHSVVQAARPRSAISPILFGVGVSLDHTFGSKWLLDVLARLGFCITRDEVNRFKQSVVQQSSSASKLPHAYPDSFTQWSGDNVDHNINSLDGTGSFHGMGIISMSTPCRRVPSQCIAECAVSRLKRARVASIVRSQGIPIFQYHGAEVRALSLLRFKPMTHLIFHQAHLPCVDLDVVWHAGWFFQNANNLRSNWSGFMQDVSMPTGDFPPPADIRMLPIIDHNPNDLSCIFSTLSFIEQQAQKLNMPTACVTFDQPLWLKAIEIVTTSRMNVVCRLGAFHTIMSFLGSIGSIMAGSGLIDALQCCYGPIAVSHMMTGKAVARALRGHFLSESALVVLLLTDVVNCTVVGENSEGLAFNSSDAIELEQLYMNIVCRTFDFASDVSQVCAKLTSALHARKLQVAEHSRTAKLWLQYIQYIDILKSFIRAERTCDWNAHLLSLSRMLNLFAASGHNHYAKSVRLYLQLMCELPHTHPWLHE
jgi:hypothetical protein